MNTAITSNPATHTNGTYTPSLYHIWIGLDPGTNTGIAVWDRHEQRLLSINTVMIHEAWFRVLELRKEFPESIYVRMEDARLISGDNQKTLGAGSIRRDCNIWQDFFEDLGIPYSCNKPQKGMTKWREDIFRRVTGWTGKVDDHGMDAALLVFKK